MPSTYTGTGGFDARERLQVRMQPGDTLFYGVRRADAGGAGLVLTLRYDNTGSNISGFILQQTTLANGTWAGTLAQAAGVIQNDAQNNAGPRYAAANTQPSAGYSPLWWHNNTGATIDVWIEFTREGTPTTGSVRTTYDLWDFTVRNFGEKPGRLFSKSWSFQAMAAGNLLSKDFQLFVAIPDPSNVSTFYVKEIDLAGTQPFGMIFKCNALGANVGATFEDRRKSIATNNADPQYNIFVNPPDFVLFPSANLPTYSIAYQSFCQPNGVDGGATFTYFSSSPGYGQIILDLNGTPGYQPSTSDVFIESFFANPGYNQIFWNGTNGLGAPVASGTLMTNSLLTGLFSPVHFPLWDVEIALTGFKIKNIRPGTQNFDKLFWDDINFTTGWNGTPVSNLTGQNSTNGVHRWSSNGGNNRLVNTWGYGRVIEITQTLLYEFICDSDGDGIANINDLDDDNDGVPDLTECANDDPLGDANSDNIPNYLDPTYVHSTLGAFVDANEDGVNDLFDKDGDGIINSFDKDSDNDGISDITENGGTDINNDGEVDYPTPGDPTTMVDVNNNGLLDALETTPLVIADNDSDGVPNYLDIDSDNDGILDNVEGQSTAGYVALSGVDSNNNGIDDAYDPELSGSLIQPAANSDASPPTGSFADSYLDYRDIDADNDGIPDIIEAQSTAGYIAPSGNDTDGDGLDDAFDADNGGTPIVLVDTDGDGEWDFRDQDSDGDAESDFIEAHDDDNDGTADHAPLNADADGDGLLDPNTSVSRFDQFILGGSGTNADNNGNTASAPFPNSSGGTEPNWRDGEEIIWNGTNWVGGSGPSNNPDDGTNDANKTVSIQAGTPAIITSPTKFSNLIISDGAELRVDNTCLQITGSASVLGTGKFTLLSTSETAYGQYLGPAIPKSEVQVFVNEEGWHNIASPVTGKTVGDFAADNNSTTPGATPSINLVSGQQNMFWYNTNVYGSQDLGHGQLDDYSHAWGKWFPAQASDRFDFSRSYNMYIDAFYNGPNQTLKIRGTLNSGDYAYITSDKYYGWNNVPNPYPTVVDWEEVIEDFNNNGTTTTDFTLSFHVWDPANNSYAAYQGVLGAGVGTGAAAPGDYVGAYPDEVDVVSNNTRYIAPFQSYWIERVDALPEAVATSVAPTDKTFYMKDSHRVLCLQARHFKTENTVEKIRLVASCNQNKYVDQTVLVFGDAFSDAYNQFEDTRKFFTPNQEVVQVFSIVENKALVIGSYEYPNFETKIIPLGVVAVHESEVTIEQIMSPVGWDVMIEDLKTGKLGELTRSTFTFTQDEDFDAHRFNLIYKNSSIDKSQFEQRMYAYQSANGIVINLHRIYSPSVDVTIFNAVGQVISQSSVSNSSEIEIALNNSKPQIYIVQVVSEGKVFVDKIVR